MANNFSGDSSVKALWRFENGALTTDSISTNTLALKNTPTVDTTAPLEGNGCLLVTHSSDNGCYVSDANLAAGFPLKSGDTTKQITVTGWYKPTTLQSAVVVAKFSNDTSKDSFMLVANNGTWSVGWVSGGSTNWGWAGFGRIAVGQTYHFGLVLDGVNKTGKLRVYSTNALNSNYTYNYSAVGVMNVGASDFCIGNGNWANSSIDGRIDEVAVFNRLLSDQEIDAIRMGGYAYPLSLPSIISDAFNGTDGNAPNSTRWFVDKPSTGDTIALLSNQLKLATDGSVVLSPSVTSLGYFTGNFDVQADYSLSVHSDSEFWDAGIVALIDGSKLVECFRQYRTSYGFNSYVGWYFDGAGNWTYLGNAATTDTSGSLRLVRIDNTIYVYYLSGSTWTLINSKAITSSVGVQIQFKIESITGHPTTDVRFYNFLSNLDFVVDGLSYWSDGQPLNNPILVTEGLTYWADGQPNQTITKFMGSARLQQITAAIASTFTPGGETGTIAGTITKLTGSISGTASSPPAGSIAATLASITAAITEYEGVAGGAIATLQKLTGSLASSLGVSGSVAATLQKLVSDGAGEENITVGDIAATLQQITASVATDIGESVGVNATLPTLIADLVAVAHPAGRIVATLPQITCSIVMERGEVIGVEANLQKITSSADGYVQVTGSIDANLKKITASVSAQCLVFGRVAAYQPKLTASITAAVTPGGHLSATLAKITANIQQQGVGVVLPRLSANFSGKAVVRGSSAAATKKITAAATGERGVAGGVHANLRRLWASNILPTGQADAVLSRPPITADIEGQFGNNFSSARSLAALWRFEPNALTTDNGPYGLTLTNHNVTSAPFFREGNGAGSFNGSSYLSIRDQDVPQSFPFKSGDPVKQMTIMGWVYLNEVTWGQQQTVFAKANLDTNDVTFALRTDWYGFYWELVLGTGPGETPRSILLADTAGPTAGKWYHIMLAIDGNAQSAFFELYDSLTQHTDFQIVDINTPQFMGGPFDFPLYMGGADLTIGGTSDQSNFINGHVDEVMVWNGMIDSWDHARIISQSSEGPRGNNNFTGDTQLYANYRYSDAVGVTDSSGRHNTLTHVENLNYPNVGGYPWAVEGSQSAYITSYAGASGYYRNDADLSQGFPLKSNDTHKRMTFCTFLWPDRVTGMIRGGYLFSKGHTQGYPNDTGLSLKVNTGFDPAEDGYPTLVPEVIIEWTDINHTKTAFNTGILLHYEHWYHVALIVDGKAKTIRLLIYDANLNSTTVFTATAPAELKVDTGAFWIGGSWGGADAVQGFIDETLVFDSVLSDADISKIRDGKYITGQQATSGADISPITAEIIGAQINPGVFAARLAPLHAFLSPKETDNGRFAADLEGLQANASGALLQTVEYDLAIEVGERGRRPGLSPTEFDYLGDAVIKEPEVPLYPLPLPGAAPAQEEVVDRVQRLGSDASLLIQHSNLILEQIAQRCVNLTFRVPEGDTATRAALLSLHLDQDQVSFKDYIDLLQLQLDLASHTNQATNLNEAIVGASAQSDVPVKFYENQLQSNITDASAWAMQAKPLLKTQSTAQAMNDFLGSYDPTTYPPDNTLVDAMGGQGQTTLAKILEECVPCLQRTLDLSNVKPLDEILNMLQQAIMSRFNYIQSLWDSLFSNTMNLCDLMNFMNGMCIPDLFAMLAVLSQYWLQLTNLHKINVLNALWSLIQPLLQGMLMQFAGLIDRFIQLIMAPVQCVISSIDHEYAKLYNLGNAEWDPKKGLVVVPPYNHQFAKWAEQNVVNPVLKGSDATGGKGLLELKKALVTAQKWMDGQIKRLRDSIAESLGVDKSALEGSQGLFMIMRWLALVIGLIKAIIKFKQDGYQCSPQGMTDSQLNTLANYLSDTTGVPFVVAPSTDPLVSTLPSATDSGTDLINQLLQTSPITAGKQSMPSVTTSITAGVAPATYVLPNCVAKKAELERAKVASWIAELDALKE